MFSLIKPELTDHLTRKLRADTKTEDSVATAEKIDKHSCLRREKNFIIWLFIRSFNFFYESRSVKIVVIKSQKAIRLCCRSLPKVSGIEFQTTANSVRVLSYEQRRYYQGYVYTTSFVRVSTFGKWPHWRTEKIDKFRYKTEWRNIFGEKRLTKILRNLTDYQHIASLYLIWA